MSLARRLLGSPAALGIMAAVGSDALIENSSGIGARYKLSINIEYGKDYVRALIPLGIYERYDLKGFDGQDRCMQIITLNETLDTIKAIFIDGLKDNECNESIDAVYRDNDSSDSIDICEHELDDICRMADDNFEELKRIGHIWDIKREWRSKRQSCEGTCLAEVKVNLED